MRIALPLYPDQLPRIGPGQRRRAVKLPHQAHSLDKAHSPLYLITANLSSQVPCYKARAFRPVLLHVLLAQQ
jgi:hypothetical protein